MILIGVYANKEKIITPKLNKGLTDILIQIALPCMIVTSFIFTYDHALKTNIIKTFYYSFIAYILTILISYLLVFPIKKDKKTILHFANVFPNTGYVGFPILMSLYGPEGVIYGSIFNMFFVIFVWTYGLMLYKGHLNNLKSEIRPILLNPSIIAVIIGIIMMVFDVPLPSAILSSIQNIGDISKATMTVIIMTAMPASAMTSIFADRFNKERDFAAVLVALSTLLALVTVPLLLKIIT